MSDEGDSRSDFVAWDESNAALVSVYKHVFIGTPYDLVECRVTKSIVSIDFKSRSEYFLFPHWTLDDLRAGVRATTLPGSLVITK